MSRLRPPLADTVGLLLPSHAETLLLRACLRPGEEGRLAWVEWARVVQHPRSHLAGAATGTKRLLPLLHHALRGNGADPGRDLAPYLRTIALRERHRAGHVDAVLRQAAAGLERHAIGAILLKGVALAHGAYPDPALRHCHDLDFLVEPARLAAATAALAAAGFAIDAAPPGEARATHSGTVRVALHTSLFPLPLYTPPIAAMRVRCRTASIAGEPLSVLDPADALLHICGLATCRRDRDLLTWVADAGLLIERAADELDWQILVDGARTGGLALPLFVLLSYLRREIAAPVPEATLERLAADAAGSRAAQRDAVIAALRSGPRGRAKAVVRASGWRSRGTLARWLLLPSPAYLRWWCAQSGRRWTPLWYLGRPILAAWRLSAATRWIGHLPGYRSASALLRNGR